MLEKERIRVTDVIECNFFVDQEHIATNIKLKQQISLSIDRSKEA